VESSIALEAFKRLWHIANEIAAIHETEVKITASTDLSCKGAGSLPVRLTQHGLDIRRQLAEKLKKLERSWKDEENSFEATMFLYDFSCYDIISVVQEMKVIWNELKSVENKLAVISKICSYLRTKQNESWYRNSIIIYTLYAYYWAIEAKLLKQKETLSSLYSHLNKLYEYEMIRRPECIEYVKRALR
jgi:hypothetical protein